MYYLFLVSGKNGSGKTELARFLSDKFHIKHLSISTSLKNIFCDVYDITKEDLFKYKNLFRYEWNLEKVKETDLNLYDKLKNHIQPEEKHLGLVELSKELLEIHGKNFWVEQFVKNNKLYFGNTHIVVDDWRLISEYLYLKNNIRKNKIIKVRIEPDLDRLLNMGYILSDDIFENDLDNYNFNIVIENKSTLEDYHKNIIQSIRHFI